MSGLLLFVALGMSAPPAVAQTAVTAIKDAKGVIVAEAALAAHGGAPEVWGYQDSVAEGKLRMAYTGNTQHPITIRSLGLNRYRAEVLLPEGTNILVRRDDRGVIQHPDGRIRKLQPYSTLARHVDYLPMLSLLAERNLAEVAVLDKGLDVVNGRPVSVIELHLATDRYGMTDFVKQITRTRFYVDNQTGLVTKMEYDSRAEDASNLSRRTLVFFSDYRQVDGVWVPFRQTTNSDGEFDSEIVLTSVQFNTGLTEAEFQFPQ